MNKQYEVSRLFMSSIRVFAEANSTALAAMLLNNSTKSVGQRYSARKGFQAFNQLEAAYKSCDITASHTRYWNQSRDLPMRAQRLNRLVSVEEISNFFRIPIPNTDFFPGFSIDKGFGSKTKSKGGKQIRLGSYLDDTIQQDSDALFDVQQLAKHGLIVGVPGSGKTTAMFNILYQLWNGEHKIPFIILEPAKTEYRALKTLPEFAEDLLVFTLGDESVSPFRFNPMEVLPVL